MNHFVYILKDTTRLNWCKVGISKDVEKRVESMRTAAPSLELYKRYQVFDKEVAKRIEKISHDVLKDTYIKQREWFQCHPHAAAMVVDGIVEELEG